MQESDELHELITSDPELAWPRVLAFVREHPGTAEAQDFVEDLVYEHDMQFIERLEAEAFVDPALRSVIEQAYVGGVATEGAEQFNRLQERLRLGDISAR
jgi:hypothetical protein